MDLKEAEIFIDKFYDLKAKYKDSKDESSKLHSELEYAQAEFASKLEDAGLSSYKGSKGTFSFRYEDGVLTPKTIEEKQAFFNYVREKYGDEYAWNMISFNSRTLNSFFKEENNQAESEDNFDLTIPGLTRSEPRIRFSLRKQGER